MRRCLGALALLAVLASYAPAAPAAEPADSAIAGAVADLDRFEPQVQALTPSQGAGIKRVGRLLELTEERLMGSTNQGDPSWIEANERLTRLKQALADLAAGKIPGAAPAADAPAGDSPAPAADPAVAAAQAETERLGGLIEQISPDDKALIKRYRIQLDQVAERLNGVTDKSTSEFAAAASAYNALNDKLNGLIEQANAGAGGTASGGAGATAGAASGEAGADPEVERAEREMAMIERQAQSMRAGDRKLADRFLADLARIGEQLEAVPDHAHPAWQAAEDHRAALRDGIVTSVATAMRDDLQKVVDGLNRLQPVQFLVAADVEAARGEIAGLRQSLAALEAPDNPTVQELDAQVARLGELFEERVAAAEAAHAELGDIKGRLARIAERNRAAKVPAPLQGKVTVADVQAFIDQGIAVQSLAQEELAWLQQLEGRTPMTVEEHNAYRRLVAEIGAEKPRALQDTIRVSTANLDLGVERALDLVAFVEETDPADFGHRASRLVGKGAFEDLMGRLQESRAAVDVAAALDRGIGRQDGPDRAAQAQALDDAIASLTEKREIALDTIRMPEAKSDDPELLAVVEQVLGEAGHAYERAVVSTDVRHQEKDSGNLEAEATSASTVTATVTLYHYVWDEFQATTAERDGDDFYLWANEFTYYTSGSENTTLNRWILTDRFQTIRILEQNIHKD